MATTAKSSNTTEESKTTKAQQPEKENHGKTQKLRTDTNEAGNWPFPIYSKQ